MINAYVVMTVNEILKRHNIKLHDGNTVGEQEVLIPAGDSIETDSYAGWAKEMGIDENLVFVEPVAEVKATVHETTYEEVDLKGELTPAVTDEEG